MNKRILLAFALFALLSGPVKGQGLLSLITGGGGDDNEGLESARTRTGGFLPSLVGKPVGALLDGIGIGILGNIPIIGRPLHQIVNGVTNIAVGPRATKGGSALFAHDAKGGRDDSKSKAFAPEAPDQKPKSSTVAPSSSTLIPLRRDFKPKEVPAQAPNQPAPGPPANAPAH